MMYDLLGTHKIVCLVCSFMLECEMYEYEMYEYVIHRTHLGSF